MKLFSLLQIGIHFRTKQLHRWGLPFPFVHASRRCCHLPTLSELSLVFLGLRANFELVAKVHFSLPISASIFCPNAVRPLAYNIKIPPNRSIDLTSYQFPTSHSFSLFISQCRCTTGYEQDGRGLIPGTGKIFFLIVTASRPARRPIQPPIQLVPEAFFPGVKLREHEADQSPPFIAEDKNGGAIPSLSNMSLWCDA
jgi:hypothetical protein